MNELINILFSNKTGRYFLTTSFVDTLKHYKIAKYNFIKNINDSLMYRYSGKEINNIISKISEEEKNLIIKEYKSWYMEQILK